jgi:hypothetical protein
MKVALVTVPLTALLVLAAGPVSASPQSMLDPYSNVRPPSTKAKLASPTTEKAPKEPVVKPTHSSYAAPKADKPLVTSDETSGGGFLAGTKQIFHGFGTATKGAASDVVHPVKSLGGGVIAGGKKVGQSITDGATKTTEIMGSGAKKVSGGVKAAGVKVKDGTLGAGKAISEAPKKLGDGIKETGDKIKGGSESAGSKVMALPKAMGHGIVGAAEKTGEATKKVALAPLKLAGKLNPFHHKSADGVATASQPSNVQK